MESKRTRKPWGRSLPQWAGAAVVGLLVLASAVAPAAPIRTTYRRHMHGPVY